MCLLELDSHILFLKPGAKDHTYKCVFTPIPKAAGHAPSSGSAGAVLNTAETAVRYCCARSYVCLNILFVFPC